MKSLALAVLLACARIAAADPEADADAAFRRAGQLAAARDPGAIDAYEVIGRARPITRWTDDAWAEAARLAELDRDYARARADLTELVATSTDERLVARAKGSLARLSDIGDGRWDAVRAEHERLASEIYRGDGDPTPALEALGALLRANPAYPRASAAQLTLALGWETEGDRGEALAWFRAAADGGAREPGQYTRLEYARALVRAGELGQAEDVLGAVDPALVDRAGAEQARDQLATARHRRTVRIALALAVLISVAGALALARKDLRRLARPPTEVWFLAPLALLLALVALPGNPLIARAVRWIGVIGVVLAWLSGGLLEIARTRGALSARRAIVHAVLTVAVGAAAVYLVVDSLGLLDLLGETWRGGPAMD